MTLRELRYLVALAEHGHFGRAADACHVSQPTLSTQLRKLEDYLGILLVERTPRGAILTDDGLRIAGRARRILGEVDDLVHCARGCQRKPLSGTLTLGIIPSLAPYVLPWLLDMIRECFPELRLKLHEDLTDRLMRELVECRIDAALLAMPVGEPQAEVRPLFDEPFLFACPRAHALADAVSIPVDRLRSESLLLLTEGHCLRDQALSLCAGEQDGDGSDFRASSLETICRLVAAGHGATLLPGLAAQQLPAESPIVTIPIAGREAMRRIGLVWRARYPLADDLRLLGQVLAQAPPAGAVPVGAPRPPFAPRPEQANRLSATY